ncbi:MAG: hypothetical protein WCX81_02640 [Monoglobales bacterium]
MEKKFEFRKKLLQVHKENVINPGINPCEDELTITDQTIISLPEGADEVVLTAAVDFIDYLFTSMNLSAAIGKNGLIEIKIDNSKVTGYKAFEIEVSNKIKINASDSRGAAQALYYLEDLMSERKAPFIKKETARKISAFAPRIVNTGYARNGFPNEYLARIAHAGIDGIMFGISGMNLSNLNHLGDVYLDFFDIVRRAKKYGIDVYFLSKIPSLYHPDSDEGRAYYKNTYGEIVKSCPDIKGIILVGEAIGFPSRDKRTTGIDRYKSPDKIPSEKPSPGTYPCDDYCKLANIIRDVTRPHNPDIDIILWSYNWWSQEDDIKLDLIDSLDKDISFLSSFEVGDTYEMDGITKLCCDYTISKAEYGHGFATEAARAKERGLRLYSQTSTTGVTWDFGTIPYIPAPYKWIKRYKSIFEAKEKFGLAGFIECWTPGFYPSIITELTKKCYMDETPDYEKNLKKILDKNYGTNADTVDRALKIWSDATDYIHASYDEQYGPLRVGTAYPLCLFSAITPPGASPWYSTMHGVGASGFQTIYTVRDGVETEHWKKMSALMKEGADILKTIENPSDEIQNLENLGRYIYHCVETVINVHRWHKNRALLLSEPNKNTIVEIVKELEIIAADERENALSSIDCVRKDSRLGWETCDGYVGGEEAILWKVKHIDYTIRAELGRYKKELVF